MVLGGIFTKKRDFNEKVHFFIKSAEIAKMLKSA